MEPTQLALGGHIEKISIDGNEVVKGTHKTEIDFYLEAFSDAASDDLHEFAKFLPNFFGAPDDSSIRIENVLKGLKNPSVIDIKMGTSTVTFNTRSKGE